MFNVLELRKVNGRMPQTKWHSCVDLHFHKIPLTLGAASFHQQKGYRKTKHEALLEGT